MSLSSRVYQATPVLCNQPSAHKSSLLRCGSGRRGSFCGVQVSSGLTRLQVPGGHRINRPAAYAGTATGSASAINNSVYPVPTVSLWRNDYQQQYIHGKLLGAGSFGNVYLGVHRRTGGEVAVKVMPKKRGNLTREKTIGRICKEVSVLHSLQDCSNVVRLYGVFDDEDEVQVVMEYCSGGDLQRTLDVEGVLPERDLAVVAYEVLRIIQACHERSILHGDIKPANFVFAHPRHPHHGLPYGGGWLRAIDFGCSQYLPGGERLARRVGTPAYMAPEVFGRSAGLEADMWSLGVMLFQLCTGRFPFWEGRIQPGATGVEEVMEAVLSAPINSYGSMFQGLSPEGRDFILRCLQRDFNVRLSSDQALHHPWLCNMLCRSNIVPTGSYFAAERGCLTHC